MDREYLKAAVQGFDFSDDILIVLRRLEVLENFLEHVGYAITALPDGKFRPYIEKIYRETLIGIVKEG